MKIQQNVGTADRCVRFIASGLLIYMGFCQNPIVSGGKFKGAIGMFGIIILLSALAKVCPLYWIVDINTIRND